MENSSDADSNSSKDLESFLAYNSVKPTDSTGAASTKASSVSGKSPNVSTTISIVDEAISNRSLLQHSIGEINTTVSAKQDNYTATVSDV